MSHAAIASTTAELCPAALMNVSEFVTVRTIPGSPTSDLQNSLVFQTVLCFSVVRNRRFV